MALECANCAACPLRSYWERRGHWNPVGFEHNESDVLVLGDAPSKQDLANGRPFVDALGIAVMDSLEELKKTRLDVDWGNLLGCRWPDDDPKVYLAQLQKRNRKRAKKKEPAIINPVAACWPHVREELKRYQTVIPMGSYAAKAILEGNPRLEDVRGGPTLRGEQKVLPTYHPRLLQVQEHLREVFRSDIAKAFRYHRDALRWEDPKVYYQPTAEWARAWFERNRHEVLAYDVETDGIDSLTTGLRCIGIGTTDEVLMFGLQSVDGQAALYEPEEERKVRKLLAEVFTDKSILKSGHNAGYFDRTVIEQHLRVTPEPLVDTILMHKLGASEHRHRLGFVASMLLDVPAWKADHTGVTAQTDADLHAYCATDVAVTARILLPLRDKAKRRKQLHLYHIDAEIQDVCAGMHRLGMRVDEGRRAAHEQVQVTEAAQWLGAIHALQPNLNPNSHVQLRALLFDDWGLPPYEYTLAGEPSTGAASIRMLLVNPLVDEDQRALLRAVKRYRRAEKLLSTYLRKWAPGVGVVTPEGYVHPDYNAHGTVTGRLSSSNPNFQNVPYFLRDIFIPPPGCVYVGADYDQLELRFAAALSGAESYLDVFEKKLIDPHNLTADLMFGDAFWASEGAPSTRMGKGTGQFKRLRNLAKTICFASLYGAKPPKVHEIIGREEDDQGNMMYGDMDLRQVRTLHRKWLERAPEFKAWWRQTMQTLRRQGYIEECVLKRRRYFAQEDYNAVLNYGVQAGGFAVVAQGMIDLVQNHLPFDFGQGSGLVNQLHDAVLFAVPEGRAESAKAIITETLTRTVEGLPVTFTAEAEIGTSWKDC